MLVGTSLNISHYRVAMVIHCIWLLQAGSESLQEHAVDAIFLHPSEVTQDCLAIIRTKNMSFFPISMLERRRVLLVIIHIAHVRPQINRTVPWSELLVASEVNPSAT